APAPRRWTSTSQGRATCPRRSGPRTRPDGSRRCDRAGGAGRRRPRSARPCPSLHVLPAPCVLPAPPRLFRTLSVERRKTPGRRRESVMVTYIIGPPGEQCKPRAGNPGARCAEGVSMRRWRAAGPSRPGNGQVQDNGGRGRRGRVTSRVAALCATVLGAAAMVVGAGGTAAAAPPGCVSLDVIAIPGTWETSDHGAPAGSPGMLGAVTYNLPSSMRADYVPYAATAFPWEGKVYGASKHEAITNASNLIGDIAAQCPDTRFALIGYSQGADA